jgi:hypothetical protein
MSYAIDNLACVVCYFDDEGEVPYDYVLRWGNEFEAFAGCCDDASVDAISLGTFASLPAAVAAIHGWNAIDAPFVGHGRFAPRGH